MNFDLIRALDKDNFFFNGSVYLQKKVVEKTQRDRERLLLDSSSNSLLAALSTEFNFFDAIKNCQKSDSFIKTKGQGGIYNHLSKVPSISLCIGISFSER